MKSAASAARQVVQRPVERLVGHLKRVLRDELFLGRQQLGLDKREDGALDGTAIREDGARGAGVDGGEVLLAPREDRADANLAGVAVDLDALRAADTLARHFRQLLLEP